MFAEVLIEYSHKSLDKTFTYKLPKDLDVKVGMKVLVPFNNKLINGFVVNVLNSYEEDYELKEIHSITDEELILNDELIKLGNYMSNTILCSKISAYQAMLPSSYKIKRIKTNYNKYDIYVKLNIETEEAINYIKSNKRSVKQNEIINLLLEKDILKKEEIPLSIYKILLDKKIIKIIQKQKYRINENEKKENKITLNKEQEKVYKSINLNEYNPYLLYGITGSGKTEIYLNLIEDVVKKGKEAIMLVPEISLTMQIVKRFYDRFGDNVAILHSSLSEGEKHDEYLKILRKEVKIVVGTRSAIYAPFENLGIIIIDEEHSDTYKQENNPRYDAKEIAKFRANYNNIPLLMASATPSLESMARASKGVYKLLVLTKRAGNASLPEISIVDMEEEYKKNNFVFSDILIEKIRNRISKNEQVILLLNRRGYSTFINCSSCGFTYKCPNCDITLTYHKSNNNLLCHYCGYKIKKNDVCPNCHEDALNYLGLGTEKLEQELLKIIPEAKIIRMDQDTTSKKGAHDKIITLFKEEKYNVLLGTQVVSKGLDFPKVSLVGIINADTTLNIPDFRSNEITFDLLNQVSGRAGRGDIKGEVIIQTFNKNHNIFKYIKNNDYKSFYLKEMQFRKELNYSPYYFLTGIKVISKSYEKSLKNAQKVCEYLKNNLNKDTIVLGPTTASILKFNNMYRFQIIIKYKKDDKLLKILKDIDNQYILNKDVNIEIDINPIRI